MNTNRQKYSENHSGNINHKAFAQRLWGDVYIDNETNKFFVGSKNKKIDVNYNVYYNIFTSSYSNNDLFNL